MTKKEQRDAMRIQLASLEMTTYHTYSKQIELRFLMEEDVVKSSTIGITISTFPEVDTKNIIESLWKMGKTVVVPKCTPKERTMTFYKLESFDQLETVYMDLLEPDPFVTSPVTPSDIDLLVVPGIVYSELGYRIGYGGGYYDRFLVNYNGPTTSLAFNVQLCNALEKGPLDLPVDKIITNTQTISCYLKRKEVHPYE